MAATGTLPRPLRFLRPVVNRPLDSLEDMGEQLSFYGRAIGWTWRTLLSYKKEVFRLIAEVSLGSGALAVIVATVIALLAGLAVPVMVVVIIVPSPVVLPPGHAAASHAEQRAFQRYCGRSRGRSRGKSR